MEDDPHMLEFLQKSIEASASLQLIGSSPSAQKAREWLQDRELQIDVLLIDLGLTDGNGLDIIRKTKQLHPECESLVFTMAPLERLLPMIGQVSAKVSFHRIELKPLIFWH